MRRQAGWACDAQEFFSATLNSAQGRCYLTVERLLDIGWEWVVWVSKASGRCIHGKAPTAEAAMAAAEFAVGLIAASQIYLGEPGTSALHRGCQQLN